MSRGHDGRRHARGAPDWARDAVEHPRDPRRNRRLIERFARPDPGTLRPLLQLLLADALFQAGRDRAAAAGVPTRASDAPSRRRSGSQRGDDGARDLPWRVLVGTLVALVMVALALQAARASRRG